MKHIVFVGSVALAFACGGESTTNPPPGTATFALVVDGNTQTPLSCPSDHWEFAAGGASVRIANTGNVAIAYIARPAWQLGAHYVPGIATGDANELTGVLAPNATIDISTAYKGGITALLGSADAFSSGATVSDEATIPWPSGVDGADGATTMHLAQVDVEGSCGSVSPAW